MTTWTHNGKPLGQPQRPWRLTRAQRVEVEATLARVRRIDEAHSVYTAAHLIGCDPSRSAWWPGYRVARARVAIALRAALRADEDARCEEAAKAAGQYTCGRSRDQWSAGWERGYDSGISSYIEEAREWSATRRADDLVPLALWEIDERRRRETVRAVVALLTWGLS